jgi:uncharacterized protein YjbI with pentapeptide repeats
VLNVFDSRDFTIDKCTLSGCGTEGICAAEVDGLTVKGSTITHCSQDILSAAELSNAQFIDSKLTGNTLQTAAFSLTKSPSVSFSNCTITDNKAPPQGQVDCFVSLDDDESKISFTGCTITGNSGPDFAVGDGQLTTKDCTVKDNSFAFEPGEKPKPKPKLLGGPRMGAG